MSVTDQEYTALLQKELNTYDKIGIPDELLTMKMQVEIVIHPYAHCIYAYGEYHTNSQSLWDTLIAAKQKRLTPTEKAEPRAESIEEYIKKGGIIKKITEDNNIALPPLSTLLGEK